MNVKIYMKDIFNGPNGGLNQILEIAQTGLQLNVDEAIKH